MKETQEPKYDVTNDGHIINRKTGRIIPDDEPIFILRARDKHAIKVMGNYADLCSVKGHIDVVNSRIQDFKNFADANPERMREPGEGKE